MLFPISGIEVNPIIPFMVAFLVSFFTSMGGVSGAFLLLPFQVSFLGTIVIAHSKCILAKTRQGKMNEYLHYLPSYKI